MRALKPWFFARRRLLGWKVRLVTLLLLKITGNALDNLNNLRCLDDLVKMKIELWKTPCLKLTCPDTPTQFDICCPQGLNVAVKNRGDFIHKFSTAL